MRLRFVLFVFLVPVIAGLADGCARLTPETGGAQSRTLTDADQDQMAEAVLVYSRSHPTFLGANKVKLGYLAVRGNDPSSGLMENLQKDGFAFKPASALGSDDSGSDGSGSDESGHGDRYLISIGAFAPTSSTTATGELSADSHDMGAAVESYSVTRANGRWQVAGYRLLEVAFVVTPVAYIH